MHLRRRSGDRQDGLDLVLAAEMVPRQVEEDGRPRRVTLTHAIPDALPTDASETASSSILSVSSIILTESIEIIVSTTSSAAISTSTSTSTSTPSSSSTSSSQPSIPDLELSSSTLRTSTLANTELPLTTSAVDTLLGSSITSIPALAPTAEAEAEADADAIAQGPSEGDQQRAPAVGIAMGALAASGVMIGAAVALYKYKRRGRAQRASVEKKDIRHFQKLDG